MNQDFQGFYLFPDVATNTTFTTNLADPGIIQQAYGVSPAIGLAQSIHHQFFAQSYLDTYHSEIGIFNSNTYDAVMVIALATEYAGKANNTPSPTGEMLRLSMREIMNPGGAEVGSASIAEAFQLIRQGQAINYQGDFIPIMILTQQATLLVPWCMTPIHLIRQTEILRSLSRL